MVKENKMAIKNVFVSAMLFTFLSGCTSSTYEIYDPPWDSLLYRQRNDLIDNYYYDSKCRYRPTSRSYVDWETRHWLEQAESQAENDEHQQPVTQHNPFPNTARQCSPDNPCKQFKPPL